MPTQAPNVFFIGISGRARLLSNVQIRELVIILSELVDFSQSTLADNEGIFWLLDAETCLSPVGEL